MFGVGEYPEMPRPTAAMIALIKKNTAGLGFTAYPNTPKDRPAKWVNVEIVGGLEHSTGTFITPMFAFRCFGANTGECEQMCTDLIKYLKDSQFKHDGPVQYKQFELHSLAQPFDDPRITDRRAFQFTASYGLSNYAKS